MILFFHRSFFIAATLCISTWLGFAAPSGLQAQDIVGPAGSGQFGYSVTKLPNGNLVITDPFYDLPGGITDVGAVYLYHDTTQISMMTGSQYNDQVGSGGIVVLSGGNYLVGSPLWDNGPEADAGAITWGSDTAGVTGEVSSLNSLVGMTAYDNIGSYLEYHIVALSNGNYVVASPGWDNGAIVDAGAATWGNGATGVSGGISGSNSLVGSAKNDKVANFALITALNNGNYVVSSPEWDNGSIQDAGAATWANGTTGITGIISSSNSLVGAIADDMVSYGGITALSDGNYVVGSPNWDNGSAEDAGAVTWGNGTTGITGTVSATNSLVGSYIFDNVGNGGFVNVIALDNGNYVVCSPNWNNGAVQDAGAVTWVSGGTGFSGVVSSSNSLVGTSTSDRVGDGITVLKNGNYLVKSPQWNNGPATNAGAITWASGTTGILGTVSSSNSLVGTSTDDNIGNGGVTLLSNGNYVISSLTWDNGAASNAGAVTWGSGTAGVKGTVSSSNSLVGTTTNDYVGVASITPLSNGNYVVNSPAWNNGATKEVGAVTWASGTTGAKGTISTSNSLIGTTAYDNVGYSGSIALNNGNYVVSSPRWDNGAATDAGAVTWANGTTGITGVVNSSNSLVGTTANDQVAKGGSTALSNGNYVVSSPEWNNGAATKAGAATWGSGTTGITGPVSASNSLVGTTADDQIGDRGIKVLPNGDYVVWTMACDNGLVADGGAVTWMGDAVGTTGIVSETNSVRGTVAYGTNAVVFNDITNQLVVGRYPSNIVTLFSSPKPVGIARVNAPAIRVYPNPASGVVRVELPQSGLLSAQPAITLCNAFGQTVPAGVLSTEIHGGMFHATLDLSNLPAGAYLLRVDASTTRIIKR